MSEHLEILAQCSRAATTHTRRHTLACQRLLALHHNRCQYFLSTDHPNAMQSNLETNNAMIDITENVVSMGENIARMSQAFLDELQEMRDKLDDIMAEKMKDG